jgi:hypothetical protein
LPREINPELSPEIENVILKALAKEPVERYEKASDLADAFEEAIRGIPHQEARPPKEAKEPKSVKPFPRWGLFAAIAFLITAGIITAVIFFWQKSTTPIQPQPQPIAAEGSYKIGRMLFQDDFENGPSALWNYQWQPWNTKTERGNTFFVTNLEQAQEARVTGATDWTNYLLRFDFKFSEPNQFGFHQIEIKTRNYYCTATHEQYYGIVIAPDILKFAHDDCGVIKNEQVFNLVLLEDEWHSFEIYLFDNRIQVNIDGEQIMDIVNEELIPQGEIAFENKQDEQEYFIDNVVVYELKATDE